MRTWEPEAAIAYRNNNIQDLKVKPTKKDGDIDARRYSLIPATGSLGGQCFSPRSYINSEFGSGRSSPGQEVTPHGFQYPGSPTSVNLDAKDYLQYYDKLSPTSPRSPDAGFHMPGHGVLNYKAAPPNFSNTRKNRPTNLSPPRRAPTLAPLAELGALNND